jgi:hypothetical protein
MFQKPAGYGLRDLADRRVAPRPWGRSQLVILRDRSQAALLELLSTAARALIVSLDIEMAANGRALDAALFHVVLDSLLSLVALEIKLCRLESNERLRHDQAVAVVSGCLDHFQSSSLGSENVSL